MTSKQTIKILALPLTVLVLIAIPYVLPVSYMSGFVLSMIKVVASGLLLYEVGMAVYKVYDDTSFTFREKMLPLLLGALLFLGVALPTARLVYQTTYPVGVVLTPDKVKKPKEGVIYITHHSDCIYCKASYLNMKRAAFAYKRNNPGVDVQVVDIKDKTPLAKYFDKHLEHYGSIVMYDKNMEQKAVLYTKGQADGSPVANTVRDIYSRIEAVASHD